jgi:DNA-binding NarL/FixJ family response regulator
MTTQPLSADRGAARRDGATSSRARPAGSGSSRRRLSARPGVSVCIVDTQVALGEALKIALAKEEGIGSAQAARDPRTAASLVERGQVDVLVVATDVDEWDAENLLRWAKRYGGGVALVAMSGDDDPDRVVSAVLAGASSWVSKQMHVQQFAAVLVGAASGESFIPPRVLGEVLHRLATARSRGAEPSSLFATLTEREREVLHYAATGLSRAEIADELGLSLNTVRTHLQRITKKLGVRTTLEAVTRVLHERAALP